MESAALLVWLGKLWLYAGAATAAAFLLFGIDRVDAQARRSYTFRPLLVPGILLLWPLVLWRWWQLEAGWNSDSVRYRPMRAAHGWIWAVLALLIPAIFFASLSVRQPTPEGIPAIRLDASTR